MQRDTFLFLLQLRMFAVVVADVVLSLAFAAGVVSFEGLVIFDGKMHLLPNVPSKLLEISNFRKRIIKRHTLSSRLLLLFLVIQ